MTHGRGLVEQIDAAFPPHLRIDMGSRPATTMVVAVLAVLLLAAGVAAAVSGKPAPCSPA